MARGKGGQSVSKSMRDLFTGLAMVGVVLAMVLFVTFTLEEQAVSQYISVNSLDNETYCDTKDGTPCSSIRDGFDTAEDLISMGLGLLGLIAIILVFIGYVLPVIQRIM